MANYDRSGPDYARDMVQDSHGNIYITGSSCSDAAEENGRCRVATTKFSNALAGKGTVYYGDGGYQYLEEPDGMAVGPDNSIYVWGYFNGYYIMRYDYYGSPAWVVQDDLDVETIEFSESGEPLVIGTNGNYSEETLETTYRASARRISMGGTTLWEYEYAPDEVFGLYDQSRGTEIAVVSGGVVVAGYYWEDRREDARRHFLSKHHFDDGGIEWSFPYEPSGTDGARIEKMKSAEGGRMILVAAGDSLTGRGGVSAFSSDGEELWTTWFPGEGIEGSSFYYYIDVFERSVRKELLAVIDEYESRNYQLITLDKSTGDIIESISYVPNSSCDNIKYENFDDPCYHPDEDKKDDDDGSSCCGC
ncbi:MAG: hypothetical protein M5R36_06220 [Deltaproteobacteria bacterium]|nr:hypothetical protein [Deltaproteobacteria bacterium]